MNSKYNFADIRMVKKCVKMGKSNDSSLNSDKIDGNNENVTSQWINLHNESISNCEIIIEKIPRIGWVVHGLLEKKKKKMGNGFAENSLHVCHIINHIVHPNTIVFTGKKDTTIRFLAQEISTFVIGSEIPKSKPSPIDTWFFVEFNTSTEKQTFINVYNKAKEDMANLFNYCRDCWEWDNDKVKNHKKSDVISINDDNSFCDANNEAPSIEFSLGTNIDSITYDNVKKDNNESDKYANCDVENEENSNAISCDKEIKSDIDVSAKYTETKKLNYFWVLFSILLLVLVLFTATNTDFKSNQEQLITYFFSYYLSLYSY